MANMCLAPTTFSSGAQDDLAAADAYSITNTTPINSVKDLVSNSKIKVIDGMRSNLTSAAKTALTSAALLSNTLKSVSSLANGSITSRISSALNVLNSASRNIPIGTMSNMVSSLYKNSILEKASITINGITSKVLGSDLNNIIDIGNIANTTGCNNGLFNYNDYGAQAGMYSGLMNSGYNYGMNGMYGSMLGCKSSNSFLMNNVASNTLDNTLLNGDLESLSAMGQLTTSGYLSSISPGLLSNASQQYPENYYSNKSTIDNDYGKLLGSFNSINPNWNNTNRNGNNIYNLSNITNGSSGLSNLLRIGQVVGSNGSIGNKLSLLAGVVTNSSVGKSLLSKFPVASALGITAIKVGTSSNPLSTLNTILSGNRNTNIVNNPNTNSVITQTKFNRINSDGSTTTTTKTYNRYTGETGTNSVTYDRYGNRMDNYV